MSKLKFILIVLLFCAGLGVILYFTLQGQTQIGLMIGCIIFSLVLILFLKKNKNDELFIEIDNNGIWIKNREITNWNNYIKSQIAYVYKGIKVDYHKLNLEEKNNKDLHKLISVEHYKDGENGYFIHRIYFAGTEDKTLEEVIEAIEKFYNSNKKAMQNFKKLR